MLKFTKKRDRDRKIKDSKEREEIKKNILMSFSENSNFRGNFNNFCIFARFKKSAFVAN